MPAALATIFATVFVAELTDKDALLLLALATRERAAYVFVAGAVAFTITTVVIVTLGVLLVALVPIFWIKLAGGAVMLLYSAFEWSRGRRHLVEGGPGAGGLFRRWGRTEMAGLAFAIGSLIILDLAGDATELITIVFVAHYQDALLVFVGVLAALVAATALETFLGNRLGRVLTPGKLNRFSVVVFLALGLIIVATTLVLPGP